MRGSYPQGCQRRPKPDHLFRRQGVPARSAWADRWAELQLFVAAEGLRFRRLSRMLASRRNVRRGCASSGRVVRCAGQPRRRWPGCPHISGDSAYLSIRPMRSASSSRLSASDPPAASCWSAPLRIAPLRSTANRFAPARSAPVKSAPLRSALYRVASLRSASARSASLRSAPVRQVLIREMRVLSYLGSRRPRTVSADWISTLTLWVGHLGGSSSGLGVSAPAVSIEVGTLVRMNAERTSRWWVDRGESRA